MNVNEECRAGWQSPGVEAVPWQRQFSSFLSFVSSPTRSTCDIRYPQLKQDMLPGFSEIKNGQKDKEGVIFS